jgi:hypothetical protein
MFLIQLLVPTKGPDSAALDAQIAQTRTELTEQFGGVTAYERAPAKGAWLAPEGTIHRDELVTVEVVANVFDRSWWQGYRAKLEERFAQREIHVRAIEITIP